jgi:hypothetical protein
LLRTKSSREEKLGLAIAPHQKQLGLAIAPHQKQQRRKAGFGDCSAPKAKAAGGLEE